MILIFTRDKRDSEGTVLSLHKSSDINGCKAIRDKRDGFLYSYTSFTLDTLILIKREQNKKQNIYKN